MQEKKNPLFLKIPPVSETNMTVVKNVWRDSAEYRKQQRKRKERDSEEEDIIVEKPKIEGSKGSKAEGSKAELVPGQPKSLKYSAS